jgi:hypothetical protein
MGLNLFDVDAHENEAVAALRARGGNPGGWEGRWDRAFPVLDERERSDTPWIVDMGAGTLQSSRARQFVRQRLDRTIAVLVPLEELRRRHAGRDPEELQRVEWSDDLVALYEGCRRKVDATEDEERSATELKDHILEALEA